MNISIRVGTFGGAQCGLTSWGVIASQTPHLFSLPSDIPCWVRIREVRCLARVTLYQDRLFQKSSAPNTKLCTYLIAWARNVSRNVYVPLLFGERASTRHFVFIGPTGSLRYSPQSMGALSWPKTLVLKSLTITCSTRYRRRAVFPPQPLQCTSFQYPHFLGVFGCTISLSQNR